MPCQRLILPVDLDGLHRFVLPYAAPLARLLGAQVTLLHVVEKGHLDKYAEKGESRLESARARAERFLREAAADPLLRGLTVRREVVVGDRAGVTLVERAGPDDLLCVPARRRGGWRRLLFGSVTEELLHAVRTPALFVQVPEDGIPARDPRWERILVPTDLSGVAEKAAQVAAEIAQRTGGRAVLVHVFEEMPPAGFQLAGIRSLLDLRPELRQELERRLADRARALFGDMPHETHLLTGAPAERIAAFSRDHPVDLVVMASRGHDSLGDHFFGSTTDRVVRSVSVPVWVVPAP